MSALGQKQTFAPQKGTSALPRIATAKADSHKWSCRLYPRKRTFKKLVQPLNSSNSLSVEIAQASAIQTFADVYRIARPKILIPKIRTL